jgi:hypothetical protein
MMNGIGKLVVSIWVTINKEGRMKKVSLLSQNYVEQGEAQKIVDEFLEMNPHMKGKTIAVWKPEEVHL